MAEGRSAKYVWRSELLRAAQWRAARYGLSDRLLDPTSGKLGQIPRDPRADGGRGSRTARGDR